MSIAEKGKNILLKKSGYFDLTNVQKSNLMVAFAKKGKALHKKAFDLVYTDSKINFSDEDDVRKKLDKITLIEIKATNRDLDKSFSKYWFGITMRELILGQSLRKQYKFVFINITSNQILELDISGVLGKLKNLDVVFHAKF